MDTIILICFVIFLYYLYRGIRRGMFADRSRRPLYILELILLLVAVIYTAPATYRVVSEDIVNHRITPDVLLRIFILLCSVYIIIAGVYAMFKGGKS